MLPCDIMGPLDGVSDLLLGASIELVLLVGLLVLVPHLGCILRIQLALKIFELWKCLFVELSTHPSKLLVELTGLPLRRVGIVGIAGGEQLDAGLSRQVDEVPVDRVLLRQLVELDLEEEVLGPHRIREPVREVHQLGDDLLRVLAVGLAAEDRAAVDSTKAGRGPHDPLAVLPEEVEVDAWIAVETVLERRLHEAIDVRETFGGLRHRHEVVATLPVGLLLVVVCLRLVLVLDDVSAGLFLLHLVSVDVGPDLRLLLGLRSGLRVLDRLLVCLVVDLPLCQRRNEVELHTVELPVLHALLLQLLCCGMSVCEAVAVAVVGQGPRVHPL